MHCFDVKGITHRLVRNEIKHPSDGREKDSVADEMQYLRAHHHLTPEIRRWEKIGAGDAHGFGHWTRHVRNVAAAEIGNYPLGRSQNPYRELDRMLDEMTNLECQAESHDGQRENFQLFQARVADEILHCSGAYCNVRHRRTSFQVGRDAM